MTITALRKELIQARTYVQEGLNDQALETLDQAINEIHPDNLLTTTKAAEYLGLGSANTVKALVRRLGLRYETHGNRMMIPVRELEGIRDGVLVHALRASDQAHEATAALDGKLSPGELAGLSEGRPGQLPWKRGE